MTKLLYFISDSSANSFLLKFLCEILDDPGWFILRFNSIINYKLREFLHKSGTGKLKL